jgi:hypothetical protein
VNRTVTVPVPPNHALQPTALRARPMLRFGLALAFLRRLRRLGG